MADGMPRYVARLYSHFTRLSQGQLGLPRWSDADAGYLLRDAVELIETAFVEQELDDDPNKRWQSSLRRAGEILEWLSHPEIGLSWQIPTEMLSAAIYQLAGYPARSAGLLSQDSSSTTDSRTLRAFLQADFKELFVNLVGYWVDRPTDIVGEAVSSRALVSDSDEIRKQINQLVTSSTLSAMGVIASEMRWGDEKRAKKAIEKLEAVSRFLLHSDDQFSWLLAKLCAMIGTTYLERSLRRQLAETDFGQWGQEPVERYLRLNYYGGKTLAWPSQIHGIKKLETGASFALCTPTGSGKTTVAEIAILQGVFSPSLDSLPIDQAPLVVYLVPTRALATEVEFKLSRVFRQLGPDHPIVVTGLYGGTDWGPTDAWITRTDTPAVLICTYEKAEALIRFMGPAFLQRISLVILDEAHKVQFDGEYAQLARAENRSLRLEWLGTRLFSIAERNQGRVVALSAVAQEIEDQLACWVTGASGSEPVRVSYRSTRQLIGRLECQDRGFTIKYDLLDRTPLRFGDDASFQDTPYIPNPFPPHPPASLWEREEPIERPRYEQLSFLGGSKVTEGKKPKSSQKRLYPYLYWAAMQLAAIRNGQQRTVLVSVPQNPGKYAREFLDLLEVWKDQSPVFFQSPAEEEKKEILSRCLASCADYFGEKSPEYRLLVKGVIVHHGKMPGLMARLLIELIQERVINLVIATSTLTEGVNLPFEVVLIPNLRRAQSDLSSKELANLIGRAGRPGYGTEGRSLVLITNSWARERYFRLIAQLENQIDRKVERDENRHLSPLEALLFQLYTLWQKVSKEADVSLFLEWLEETSPDPQSKDDEEYRALVDPLDTLDHVLLTAVAELESTSSAKLSPNDIELELRKIWARSYAHFALSEEQKLEEMSSGMAGTEPLVRRPVSKDEELEEMFVRRGKAIVDVYPSREARRRLYYTSLPPRSGVQLLSLYPQIQDYLKSGEAYADWDRDQRFEYIQGAVELVGEVPRFAPESKVPEGAGWQEVLHWWLDPGWGLDSNELVLSSQPYKRPSPEKVPQWYHYVHQSFIYRFNWGLGSFSALALNELYGEEVFVASIEDWPLTGLPWIVFWLKELVTWGTLDPVVAYLLSVGGRTIATRQEAARRAQDYYDHSPAFAASPDDFWDPSTIREWARERLQAARQRDVSPRRIKARLLKDFENVNQKEFRVLPALKVDRVLWLDPAGFLLAESTRPDVWHSDWLYTMDFSLDHAKSVVHARRYL